MQTQVGIKPSRENWRQFCEELPLSDEEHDAWEKLAELCQEDEKFSEYLYSVTATQQAILNAASRNRTTDYSDLVKRVDARRKLGRAEIEAYEADLKRKFEEQGHMHISKSQGLVIARR